MRKGKIRRYCNRECEKAVIAAAVYQRPEVVGREKVHDVLEPGWERWSCRERSALRIGSEGGGVGIEGGNAIEKRSQEGRGGEGGDSAGSREENDGDQDDQHVSTFVGLV